MKFTLAHNQLIELAQSICSALSLSFNRDNLMLGLPQGTLAAHHLEHALENINVHTSAQTDFSDFSALVYPALLLDADGHLWFYQSEDQCLFKGSEHESLKPDDVQCAWHVSHKHVTDKRSDQLHQRKQHWLKPVFDQVRPFYSSLLLASLTINLLALVLPLFTMNVYDRVVPNAAVDTLWVLAIGALIAVVFDWLLKQARGHLTDAAGRQIDVRISSALYARVLGMRLEHRPASAGAYAKQVQDFDSVRDFITSATLVSVIDLPFTLLFLALIFWLGGLMVLVPALVLLVIVALSVALQFSLNTSVEEASKLSTQRQAYLIEYLNQLVELKQSNGQGKAQQQLEQTLAQMVDWQNKSRHTANTLNHSIAGFNQFTSIALIVFGVYLISSGDLSMGGLIAVVMLSSRASGSIAQLAGLVLKFKQTQTAMESVKQILALPQEQQSQQHTLNHGFEGSYTLRHLGFTYPDQKIAALEDINLSIEQGEKIGLYGNAGSGKSSLLALLSGQYQASTGQLLIDNIDAQHWSLSTLRAHTGWVGQSPSLFFGSVLDNITMGVTSVDAKALADALEVSGVNRFIDRLEAGLETQVGEFGRQLSGGQRQAVCVARALLQQRKVLLLDEPSSAMDEQHERLLINSLRQRQETMVIASHKPALLALCDRVVVLNNGRITDIKSPQNLFSPKRNHTVKVNPNKQVSKHSAADIAKVDIKHG